jgi:hypothetical protein
MDGGMAAVAQWSLVHSAPDCSVDTAVLPLDAQRGGKLCKQTGTIDVESSPVGRITAPRNVFSNMDFPCNWCGDTTAM